MFSSGTIPSTQANDENNAFSHSDFALLNSRSICNKVLPIKDWMVDNHCDFLAITETWLKSEDTDGATVKDLCPTGYDFIHQPRLNGLGGGVGLLYRSVFQVRSNDIKTFSTFEYLDVFVNYDSTCLNIIVLYRPPNTSVRVFIDEFSSLLEQVVLLTDYPLIVGDFNIHVDNPDDSEAADFDVYSILLAFVKWYIFQLIVMATPLILFLQKNVKRHLMSLILCQLTHVYPITSLLCSNFLVLRNVILRKREYHIVN